jgi:arylsulfatase A
MRPFFLVFPAFLLSCFAAFAAPAAGSASRPNIVILYADDMGYGDLGANNPQSKIPTPHLDRLAAQGMRFTDGHSSSGVCTPSRYALLTGRFHWRKFHNIVDSFGPPVFDAREETLAGMLKGKGYRTACFGKWHLGWDWDGIRKPGTMPETDPKTGRKVFTSDCFDWGKPLSGGPLSRGFDTYFGDDVPNFPPYAWFENDRIITRPTRMLELTIMPNEGEMGTRPGPMTPEWDFEAVVPRITERAVEWIGGRRGKADPFFLYVPFNSPHEPILPTKEFTDTSKAGPYGDFVVQTDAEAGRILRALEENGFADNTLVVFSSDNGPEKYAYPRIRKHGHRSAGPLRGVKRDLYEGGHRVPFLVKWPGKVKPGSVSDALVSQVDLFATIAAVVGRELSRDIAEDSHNLLPLLEGKGPGPRRSIVHNTLPDAYAVRDGDWVLIAGKSGAHIPPPPSFEKENGYSADTHPGELYNLREDLAQKNNLYAKHPEKVKELTRLLQSIRAKGQVR